MPVPGHVYILKNPRVPSLVKIGMTNDLQRRIAELNAHAGVGGRWDVAGFVIADDMAALETATHRRLSNCRDRQSGGQEMFECDDDAAALAILQAAAASGITILKDALPATVRAAIQKQRAEAERLEQQRRLHEKQETDRWRKHFEANAAGLASVLQRVDEQKLFHANSAKNWRQGVWIGLIVAGLSVVGLFERAQNSGWWLLAGVAWAGFAQSKREEHEKARPSLPTEWQLLLNRGEQVFGHEELARRLSEAGRPSAGDVFKRNGLKKWLRS